MNFVIPSERHQKSLEFAINKASASRIFPYIKHIILFGSCGNLQKCSYGSFPYADKKIEKIIPMKGVTSTCCGDLLVVTEKNLPPVVFP